MRIAIWISLRLSVESGQLHRLSTGYIDDDRRTHRIQTADDGHKLNIFLIMLVANLIGSAGQMACYVGLLFTMPLAMIMLATVYVRLKAKAGAAPEADALPAALAEEV